MNGEWLEVHIVISGLVETEPSSSRSRSMEKLNEKCTKLRKQREKQVEKQPRPPMQPGSLPIFPENLTGYLLSNERELECSELAQRELGAWNNRRIWAVAQHMLPSNSTHARANDTCHSNLCIDLCRACTYSFLGFPCRWSPMETFSHPKGSWPSSRPRIRPNGRSKNILRESTR